MEKFLAEAALALAQSLDYEATIERLVHLAVPRFADWCLVDLLTDDGESFDRIAIGHHVPGADLEAKSPKRRYSLDSEQPAPVRLAVRERRPQLLRDLDRAPREQADSFALGCRSSVSAPMLARGRALGALSLISRERNFDEQDVRFAAQLANGAAAAIDSARLFQAERRARIRVTRLQEITAALSRASTPQEVAQTACRIGTEAADGQSGALWLVQGDGSLRLADSYGIPAAFIEPFRVIAKGTRGSPAIQAVESGQAVWVETEADYRRVAPEYFAASEAAKRVSAYCALPIDLDDRVAGVLVFSHVIGHVYDATDRAFYTILAQHCSQALDRARLLDSERRANARLRLLARVGEALSNSLQLDEALGAAAKLVVPELADWCVIDLVEGQTIRRVATEHQDAGKVKQALERAARYAPRVGDGSAIDKAIAGSRPVFHPRLPVAVVESSARDDLELQALRQERLMSAIVVPLSARGICIGALSLATSDSGRVYDESDLGFAEELGRRVALAIANTRMRREVEEAHSRLHSVFRQAPFPIGVFEGPEHRIVFANEKWEALVGHPLPAGQRLVDAVPELAAQNILPMHDRALAGETVVGREVPIELFVNGVARTHYFHVILHPLASEAGHIDGHVTMALDVTEQALARSEIEGARRAAESANKTKDDFLAMLGHELRNPLAPILTALNLMELRGVSGAERELSVIGRQVRHLTRLVDDLLDVSRITRGKVELVKEHIALEEVVGRALELASPVLEERKLHVQVQLPREGLAVHVDAARLAQALSNLLTNAAKYTDAGGHVAIVAERVGSDVSIEVSDDGIGIRAEMLERIFELFVQEEQALDRARGGLGLGLAIVKSVATMHGGSVTAQSDGPGQGSVFSLRLPLDHAPSAGAAKAAATPAQAAEAANRRVLIVDDNEDAADLLAIALEAAGCITRVAFDGPSALRLLDEFQPQAAVLDIGLPAMDGYELAARVKARQPEMRLIALTGYGQERDRERALGAGFDQHLVKPASMDQVLAAIRGGDPSDRAHK